MVMNTNILFMAFLTIIKSHTILAAVSNSNNRVGSATITFNMVMGVRLHSSNAVETMFVDKLAFWIATFTIVEIMALQAFIPSSFDWLNMASIAFDIYVDRKISHSALDLDFDITVVVKVWGEVVFVVYIKVVVKVAVVIVAKIVIIVVIVEVVLIAKVGVVVQVVVIEVICIVGEIASVVVKIASVVVINNLLIIESWIHNVWRIFPTWIWIQVIVV